MPDLSAWARELLEAAAALDHANLILADHLLTNVQLKIRALRAAQLLEAAQARKTVLPAAEPPKRRGGVRVVNSNKRASARRSVIDQLCEED